MLGARGCPRKSAMLAVRVRRGGQSAVWLQGPLDSVVFVTEIISMDDISLRI